MMKRSIKVTRMITEALQPLQQMFNGFKRLQQKLPNTMFFHKLEKKKKCSLSKNLSHQNHLCLTSSSHNRFRLLSLLHLPKMILITVVPFRLKVNSQLQRHNAYTINPLQFLMVVNALLSNHSHHCHHHH